MTSNESPRSDEQMRVALLPCPFCGYTADKCYHYSLLGEPAYEAYVYCCNNECLGRTHGFRGEGCTERAVRAWNTRAALQSPPQPVSSVSFDAWCKTDKARHILEIGDRTEQNKICARIIWDAAIASKQSVDRSDVVDPPLKNPIASTLTASRNAIAAVNERYPDAVQLITCYVMAYMENGSVHGLDGMIALGIANTSIVAVMQAGEDE